MDDASTVRVGDRVADLDEDLEPRLQGVLGVVGPACLEHRRGLVEQLLELFALHELHCIGQRRVPPIEAVDRHDVRVVELGGDLHLADEALQERAVSRGLGQDGLERDRAAQDRVAGQADRAHRALAELGEDLVASARGGLHRDGRDRLRNARDLDGRRRGNGRAEHAAAGAGSTRSAHGSPPRERRARRRAGRARRRTWLTVRSSRGELPTQHSLWGWPPPSTRSS
jgi:hypothetical protein